MHFRPATRQQSSQIFRPFALLASVTRFRGRSLITTLLGLSLATTPASVSADPVQAARRLAGACLLLLGNLASGQEMPKDLANPADPVPARRVVDGAGEIEGARRLERDPARPGARPEEGARAANEAPPRPFVDAAQANLRVVRDVLAKPFQQRAEVYLASAVAATLVGVGFAAGWSRWRGYKHLSDTVMSRRKDILAEEKHTYDAAKLAFERAEQVLLEAIERATVNDANLRHALRERAEAQVTGPMKDRLLEVLRERPAVEGTEPAQASVPVGPSVEEATTELAAKYDALRAVYQKVRQRLLDSGVRKEELPEMPDAKEVVRGVAEDLHLLLRLDRQSFEVRNITEALNAINDATAKWLAADPRATWGGWMRGWGGAGVIGLGLGLTFVSQYWPMYVAGAAAGFAVYRATNAVTRWRVAVVAAVLAVVPTTGYVAHQYFHGLDAKVEQAETWRGQQAVEDRWLDEGNTARHREEDSIAQAFELAWNQVDSLRGVPSPLKPSGTPFAPNPASDAIQSVLQKARADIDAQFGKDGEKHLVELYAIVARAFAQQSPEFRELTVAEQDEVVRFLARQMVAHPHRSLVPGEGR
jgi:hypothetical protein